ncbi:MAG: cobalamin-dependent protein [Proteobacteria bacterium]|nr:cobalamin-dependent protein [Pseudomonadota bacterium]
MDSIPPAALVNEKSYRQYLNALIAGDQRQCQEIFEAWFAANPDLCTLYDGLVQRSLYEVGELWERNQISVATEHLATAISEGLMNLVYPRLFKLPRVGKSAVVACSANEYHQIGGKMVADIFEANGWRGYFLGASTSPQELLELIQGKRPDVVALSVAVHANLDALLGLTETIRGAFADLPILVGGQAFLSGGRERAEQIAGVHYLASLAELEAWVIRHAG